jgi:hypothetical protein
MVLQGINVNLSTFSKASKIRETSSFEEIIVGLNKRLVAKKGIENARALFPIDSTIISLTSKLLWSRGWHQVKLFSGLNSITTEVGGIVIHFGQGHDSKEGGKTIEAIPVNAETLNPVTKLYIDKQNTPITSNFKLNTRCSSF